jgi:hypothetical protein
MKGPRIPLTTSLVVAAACLATGLLACAGSAVVPPGDSGLLGAGAGDMGPTVVDGLAPDGEADAPAGFGVDAPAVADGPGARDVEVPLPPIPDGASCGGPGQRCCSGNRCGDGGCCVFNWCVAAGASCRPLSGTCNQGSCGACGGRGQPCCAAGVTGAPTTCTAAGTQCQAAIAVGPNMRPSLCVGCGTIPDGPCCGQTCFIPGATCAPGLGCRACGQPGQRCCDGDRCANGGCCHGSSCFANGARCGLTGPGGQCSDGTCLGCGAPGQPCCGPLCRQGAVCVTSTGTAGSSCVVCGGPGQACCPGGNCSDGFGCANLPQGSVCQPCGGPGQTCCAGARCADGGCCEADRCVAAGGRCAGSAICADGKCPCGRAGERCCPGQTCAGLDLACAPNGMCARCGGLDGPCCPASSCLETGLTCSERRCVPCGLSGNPCCPGRICNDPSDVSCEGQGQGVCRPCGTPGAFCCPGNVCRGGGCCMPEVVTLAGPTPHFCRDVGFACGPLNPIASCGQAGSCGTCGSVGQPCCVASGAGRCTQPGSFCHVMSRTSHVCRACGGPDQPCCVNYATEAPAPPGTCRKGLTCTQTSPGMPDAGTPASYSCRPPDPSAAPG